jgi:hypothetical protein
MLNLHFPLYFHDDFLMSHFVIDTLAPSKPLPRDFGQGEIHKTCVNLDPGNASRADQAAKPAPLVRRPKAHGCQRRSTFRVVFELR